MTHLIGDLIKNKLGLWTAQDWTKHLAAHNDCHTAVDIGCGTGSPLTSLRPQLRTVGIDSSETALEQSRAAGAHDDYVHADILKEDVARLLPKDFDGKADIVALYGVIEHLPKSRGLELLIRCEALARKLVILETPNGFVPQGAEFGNEHQRHLSGWFVHDFEGYGFTVAGTTGTRYLLGYGAGLKYPVRGLGSLDVILSRVVGARSHPERAFNLFAYKDLRGFVGTRMG